jgi:hypothetical protein
MNAHQKASIVVRAQNISVKWEGEHYPGVPYSVDAYIEEVIAHLEEQKSHFVVLQEQGDVMEVIGGNYSDQIRMQRDPEEIDPEEYEEIPAELLEDIRLLHTLLEKVEEDDD